MNSPRYFVNKKEVKQKNPKNLVALENLVDLTAVVANTNANVWSIVDLSLSFGPRKRFIHR